MFLFLPLQSPKAFLESYEDMLLYTQRDETWPITKMELEGRGVSNTLIQLLQACLVPFIEHSLHQLVSSGIAWKCHLGGAFLG